MHFRNHRNSSIINKKLSRPCPYHSRVSSVTDESKLQRSISVVYAQYAQKNRKSRGRTSKQTSSQSKASKLPKIKKNKLGKTQSIQPLIQPQYYGYGQRLNIQQNYYEDMKLENQGWPSKAYRIGKLQHARHQDVFVRAQQQVKKMYEDQYFQVREELEIINRIKQRYKILRNIQQDKNKYRNMLKQMIKPTYDTDDQNYEEKQNNFNDSILHN